MTTFSWKKIFQRKLCKKVAYVRLEIDDHWELKESYKVIDKTVTEHPRKYINGTYFFRLCIYNERERERES